MNPLSSAAMILGGPYSSFFRRHQQNEGSGSNVRGSRSPVRGPSRFKGLVPFKSGTWGARISHDNKVHWLGTFVVDEEAAVAYDRAAIKLQRSDAYLNFPRSNYSPQEIIFQSKYSNEGILNMLRDKSYSYNLSLFIFKQSLVMRTVATNPLNQRGLSYQLLFQKQITQSDVAYKYMMIPKIYAAYFPQLNGNESESVEVTFYDKLQRSWNFRYAYWKSTSNFMFARGWKYFIDLNNVHPGDTVTFYRCMSEVDLERTAFYMIDAHTSNGQSLIVGQNVECGIGVKGNNRNLEDGASCKFKVLDSLINAEHEIGVNSGIQEDGENCRFKVPSCPINVEREIGGSRSSGSLEDGANCRFKLFGSAINVEREIGVTGNCQKQEDGANCRFKLFGISIGKQEDAGVMKADDTTSSFKLFGVSLN